VVHLGYRITLSSDSVLLVVVGCTSGYGLPEVLVIRGFPTGENPHTNIRSWLLTTCGARRSASTRSTKSELPQAKVLVTAGARYNIPCGRPKDPTICTQGPDYLISGQSFLTSGCVHCM
jgi:hypothetical protein